MCHFNCLIGQLTNGVGPTDSVPMHEIVQYLYVACCVATAIEKTSAFVHPKSVGISELNQTRVGHDVFQAKGTLDKKEMIYLCSLSSKYCNLS